MSVVKSDPTVETEGVSPKVAWPTVALTALGVAIAVLDAAGVLDVEDEIWVTLLGAAGGVGAIGYSAKPALQRARGAVAGAVRR